MGSVATFASTLMKCTKFANTGVFFVSRILMTSRLQRSSKKNGRFHQELQVLWMIQTSIVDDPDKALSKKSCKFI